jgi:hypothetical protein
MAGASQGEIAVRRTRVFVALCNGRTPAEICAGEGISEDTLGRDIKAVQERLTVWAGERVNRALSFALSQLERAMTEAWDAYAEQRTTMQKWLAGDYDRTELHPDADGGMREVRKPPILKLEIAALLGKAIEATREYAKLAGLDKAALDISGDILVRRYEGDVADGV